MNISDFKKKIETECDSLHLEEFSLEFQLDSTIINNVEYKYFISRRVMNDIEKGLITEDSITYSLMDIPKEVYEGDDEKDFLIDCKGTKTRLVLTKKSKKIIILIALEAKDFQIY